MIRRGALKVKAQLFCAGERAMGPGRADLLEAIAWEGSISGAGRALGMSYRYTWLMVDSMNRCFTDKLVEAAGAVAAPALPTRGARRSKPTEHWKPHWPRPLTTARRCISWKR